MLKSKKHVCGYAFVDVSDMYPFIDENNERDVELITVVQKYCYLLNYYNEHNKGMMFFDREYIAVKEWLKGYFFAKKVEVKETVKDVQFTLFNTSVVIEKPTVEKR